ncbi:hypothetical protein ES703_05694 [subsurface metagenome]
MNRYTLSEEGRSRFRRIKLKGNTEMARMEGYEVLDYLYENGPGTVEEIAQYAGLSRVQAMDRLWAFIHQRLVQKLADL